MNADIGEYSHLGKFAHWCRRNGKWQTRSVGLQTDPHMNHKLRTFGRRKIGWWCDDALHSGSDDYKRIAYISSICVRVCVQSGDDAMMLSNLGVMITNGSHTHIAIRGVCTVLGLRNVEKCFEKALWNVCSAFQNLRLVSIKLLQKIKASQKTNTSPLIACYYLL